MFFFFIMFEMFNVDKCFLLLSNKNEMELKLKFKMKLGFFIEN